MVHPVTRARLGIAAALMFGGVSTTTLHGQENGCSTGANAAADAYILSNPIYSYYFGQLEEYVAKNKAHFQAGGDAIRCLTALSRVFTQAALQMYDPTERARRDAINAELGQLGISPGQPESTPSADVLAAGMRLARLGRTLPSASEGDFGPYRTPITELEQMQTAAEQVLRMFFQDPEMRAMMSQIEPMIRELATMEHGAIIRQAAELTTGVKLR